MQPKSFSAVDHADEDALMARRKRFDVAARRSALMGAAVGKRLHAAGMSAEAFAHVFGVPVSQVHRVLQGKLDGKIPVSLQVALEYVERHGEELCRRPELPDMGRNRRGYRLFDVIGWDIYRRLQAIGWSIPDLARFVGMTDRTMRDIIEGRRDGTITLLFERMVEFVERHPIELQALPRVQTPVRASPARRQAIGWMRERLGGKACGETCNQPWQQERS